jgi:hypothetical protein
VLFCPGRLQPYSQILGKARKPFRSSTLAYFASKAGAYTSGVLYVALLPGQAPGLCKHNASLNTRATSLVHSTLRPESAKLEELMVPHSVDKLLTLLANIRLALKQRNSSFSKLSFIIEGTTERVF